MSIIFVTGAGGFVGRRLIALLAARGDAVIGMGRGAAPEGWPESARWVRADLADAPAYESALEGVDCVIHLAATTGKAPASAYGRGNVEATATLLGAAARAGAGRFIFVSSIAAGFADRRHYHYGQSKRDAEGLVRDAALRWVIVRPTMILGPGSALETSLGKLAGLPLSPLFGDGRNLVQPIDVEDVAEALAALAHAEDISGALIELGGPEAFPMRTLYARLREAHGRRGAPRFLPLPLGLMRWGLALVEKPLLPLLPFTAGQLASFANDGAAAPHPAQARLLPRPRPAPRRAGDAPAPPSLKGAPETLSPAQLDEEFTRHARYLAGLTPSAYQLEKHRAFYARRTMAPANAFDALLLKLSRQGALGLALADSYSGLFYRRSLVRAKLVLALALLESAAPSFARLDTPQATGAMAFARMGLSGVLAGLSVFIGALFLLPAQLLLARKAAR